MRKGGETAERKKSAESINIYLCAKWSRFVNDLKCEIISIWNFQMMDSLIITILGRVFDQIKEPTPTLTDFLLFTDNISQINY